MIWFGACSRALWLPFSAFRLVSFVALFVLVQGLGFRV